MKKSILLFILISLTIVSSGQWTKDFLVDKFGDKTNVAFIGQSSNGTFSNSATIGSKLSASVKVLYEKSQTMLRIDLLEYSNSLPNFRNDERAILTIKTIKGDKFRYRLANYSNHLEYNMTEKEGSLNEDDKKDTLLNKLKTESGIIKFHIQMENGSTYEFNVNPKGFSTALKSL